MKTSPFLVAVTAVLLMARSPDAAEPFKPKVTLEKAAAISYYPSLQKLVVRAAEALTDDATAPATVQVRRADDERVLAEGRLLLHGESRQLVLDLPSLSDGGYDVRIALGENGPFMVKRFQHKNYPWLGNTLGISHKIYPPFEPIAVSGNEARVVLRQYTMNGFGLWDSVISKGKEILAAPIALRLLTANGEERWQFSPGKWTSQAADAVVYQAEAESAPVRVRTTSTIEVDGCMKVEIELLPGRRATEIQRLSLEIPLKDREAPLFHYCAFECMRRNYAGQTPRGGKIIWGSKPEEWLPPLWHAEPGSDDGVLWTCRDIRPWSHVIATDFVPYLWLGGAERGLAFFGENDRGYRVDPKGIVQTLKRRGEQLVLRIDFVNRPSLLKTPHRLVFGLQASPTRPMPRDWRNQQGVPPHSGPVVCWGGYICADKYPDGHNFEIVDAIQQVRATGKLDLTVFEQFDRQRAEPWKHPWGKADNPWFDGNFRYFVNQAQCAFAPSQAEGKPHPFTLEKRFLNCAAETYFEEHASDVSTEEWEVYQDEWRAQWPWRQRDEIVGAMQPMNNYGHGHQNFPASYRDFCLHYANEWMKRGVGLYFDNTMPYTAYDPMMSAAYLDDRGKVQPACPIWEQREYYKRIWTLMMELVRQGVPRFPLAYTQHITNTRLLPWNTWCDATLDIEWEWYHVDPVRTADGVRITPFPHQLLLAETAGRQTGSLPHALAGVTGIGRDSRALSPQLARCEWGMRTVHEIFPLHPFATFENFKQLEKLKHDFGYGTPQCEVFNYWSDQPPVHVDDPDTKWLLLARREDQALLLVLQSWHKTGTNVHVTIDPARLGFTLAGSAHDAETGDEVPMITASKPTFTATLPAPYGTRVIALGASK